MKRFLSILVVFALLFSLSASVALADANAAGGRIGVAMPTQSLQRWNQDGDNMKTQLEAAGYTVDLQYANNDVATQVSQLEQMLTNGAKVLALRAVEYGRRYNVPIRVRSSFSANDGTLVSADAYGPSPASPSPASQPPHQHDTTTQEVPAMEAPIISGVAHDRSEAKITVVGVPDVPGMAARLFEAVAMADVNIDMIVQNVSAAATGLTDISFTLPDGDGPKAMAALTAIQKELGYDSLQYDDQIGKLSLVGAGMKSHPGVTAKLFGALRDAGINIEMITTSEIRISVVTRADSLDDAVRAVHSAFGLDSDSEAVVYAGTGR